MRLLGEFARGGGAMSERTSKGARPDIEGTDDHYRRLAPKASTSRASSAKPAISRSLCRRARC
jgi:hypothetical protein